MRNRLSALFVTATTAAAALAGCATTAPAERAAAGDSQRIIITGFTCGDNCYLEYRLANDPAEQTRTALCRGPCAAWFENQQMPPEIVGRSAQALLGLGAQLDNDGAVMSRGFPEIRALRVEPPR